MSHVATVPTSSGARRWAPPSARQRGWLSSPTRVADLDYSTREVDTVLAYKKRNQLGRFAPTASPGPEAAPSIPPDLVPGARCQVSLSEELNRRGTIRFVGPTDFGAKDGSVWVGVEWDEPVGKNNGT